MAEPTDISTHSNYNPSELGKFSGGGGGMLEARVARLEAHVEHIDSQITDIKTDIREIRTSIDTKFYWAIAGFAAVLGVLAKGFGWL